MRKLTIIALCLASLMLMNPLITQTQETDLIGPATYPPNVNPLTGLTVDDPTVLDRRPVIVKVVNAPAEVRPQYGLMQADIVWEHLLAGGLTRFAAIYYSQAPERFGPVRSVRLVDFELLRIYRALLTGSGMAQGTLDILRRDALVSSRTLTGTAPCPAFCRDEDVNEKLEYTLFSDVAGLRELAEETERDTTPQEVGGMAFSEATPAGGVPIDDIQVWYRNTTINWAWDEASGRWLRSQDGEAHLDATSGEQLSAANVLIMEDAHVEQPFVSDQYWGPPNFAFSVNFIGSGRAILLRDGQYFEGEWRRASQDGVLTFFDQNGETLAFKPGNTFFNLMPRWVGAYNLVFGLQDQATATVNVSSVNLRWGPTQNYSAGDAAFGGDTLPVVGRNNSGTWVQVLKDDNVLWVASSLVELDRSVMTLPLVRPTNEN
mgnify:CR=1 FL=1